MLEKEILNLVAPPRFIVQCNPPHLIHHLEPPTPPNRAYVIYGPTLTISDKLKMEDEHSFLSPTPTIVCAQLQSLLWQQGNKVKTPREKNVAGNLATHHWQLLFLWAVARHDLGTVLSFSLKPNILIVKLSFPHTRVQRREIIKINCLEG